MFFGPCHVFHFQGVIEVFVYIPSTRILKQFRSKTWGALNLLWNGNERSLIYSALNKVWTSPLSRNCVFFQEICIFMNRVDIPLPLLVGREHSTLYIFNVSQCFHLGKIWRACGMLRQQRKSRNVMTSTKKCHESNGWTLLYKLVKKHFLCLRFSKLPRVTDVLFA